MNEKYTLPKNWGPHFWYVMECIAYNYPHNPSKSIIKDTKQFYILLQKLLPCEVCKYTYKNHINKYPIDQALINNDKLMDWVRIIQNETNKSIKEKRVKIMDPPKEESSEIEPTHVTFRQKSSNSLYNLTESILETHVNVKPTQISIDNTENKDKSINTNIQSKPSSQLMQPINQTTSNIQSTIQSNSQSIPQLLHQSTSRSVTNIEKIPVVINKMALNGLKDITSTSGGTTEKQKNLILNKKKFDKENEERLQNEKKMYQKKLLDVMKHNEREQLINKKLKRNNYTGELNSLSSNKSINTIVVQSNSYFPNTNMEDRVIKHDIKKMMEEEIKKQSADEKLEEKKKLEIKMKAEERKKQAQLEIEKDRKITLEMEKRKIHQQTLQRGKIKKIDMDNPNNFNLKKVEETRKIIIRQEETEKKRKEDAEKKIKLDEERKKKEQEDKTRKLELDRKRKEDEDKKHKQEIVNKKKEEEKRILNKELAMKREKNAERLKQQQKEQQRKQEEEIIRRKEKEKERIVKRKEEELRQKNLELARKQEIELRRSQEREKIARQKEKEIRQKQLIEDKRKEELEKKRKEKEHEIIRIRQLEKEKQRKDELARKQNSEKFTQEKRDSINQRSKIIQKQHEETNRQFELKREKEIKKKFEEERRLAIEKDKKRKELEKIKEEKMRELEIEMELEKTRVGKQFNRTRNQSTNTVISKNPISNANSQQVKTINTKIYRSTRKEQSRSLSNITSKLSKSGTVKTKGQRFSKNPTVEVIGTLTVTKRCKTCEG